MQAVPQHLCNPHRAIVRERVRSCFVSRGGFFGPRCAGCWSRVRQDDGSAPPGQHVWEAGVARSGGLGVGAAQGLDWASTGIPTHILCTCAWSGRAGLLWARCYFCGPTMLVPARAALGAAMLHGIVCATRGQDDDNNGNDDGWGQRWRRKRD